MRCYGNSAKDKHNETFSCIVSTVKVNFQHNSVDLLRMIPKRFIFPDNFRISYHISMGFSFHLRYQIAEQITELCT
jgi:hypothetical protein